MAALSSHQTTEHLTVHHCRRMIVSILGDQTHKTQAVFQRESAARPRVCLRCSASWEWRCFRQWCSLIKNIWFLLNDGTEGHARSADMAGRKLAAGWNSYRLELQSVRCTACQEKHHTCSCEVFGWLKVILNKIRNTGTKKNKEQTVNTISDHYHEYYFSDMHL